MNFIGIGAKFYLKIIDVGKMYLKREILDKPAK